MVWDVGKSLNHGAYLIKEVLGEGGFGITYRVHHTTLKIDMVIKTPNDDLQADLEFPKFLRHFQREAELLAQLKQVGHPHIVGVNDCFLEGKIPCLVMDWVEGVTLFDLVRDVGVLSPKEAVTYMEQIGSALIEVHRLPAVHRDAHPGNIMIPRRNFAKLIDFGIAGEIIPTQKMSSKVFGHPKFAAPEQWRGSKHPTVDIFTLSASLFFSLTAQAPEFDDHDVLKTTAQQINPRVGNSLNSLIVDGLKIDRKERPQSMKEWVKRLQQRTTNISSNPIFPPETAPTKVVVPKPPKPQPQDQRPQAVPTVQEIKPSPPLPRANLNNGESNPLRKHQYPLQTIKVSQDEQAQSLTSLPMFDSLWDILQVPFGFWTVAGYLWQTVDMQYGCRLILYLWAERYRQKNNSAFLSAITDRLGEFTKSDLTWTIISGCIAGVVLGVGGYLVIQLLFYRFDEAEVWAWDWVWAFGWAWALAFGWTSGWVVTWIFDWAFGWAVAFAFALVIAVTLALKLPEEKLQKPEKYSLQQCTLLLGGSWAAGAAVGWLLYEVVPLFYIELPAGL